jgi:hypothetical protein
MNSTVAAGWSRGLLSAWMGLVGGVGVGVFFKTDGTSWTASGVIALISGILFAEAAWSFEPRCRREQAEIEGDGWDHADRHRRSRRGRLTVGLSVRRLGLHDALHRPGPPEATSPANPTAVDAGSNSMTRPL